MATVLVVANETLGGKLLIDAVRARADKGDARFVVIAPQNRPKAGMVVYNESVRDAAQHRVDQTVRQLADVGIQATGEVMDPDPYAAVTDAVREFGADEIIISTHPETRSGWMRRDLIDRVRADTGLPVEHVIVDLDAERQEVTHTLVVANQTLGGDPLHDLMKAKAAEGPHRFTVIVPLTGGEGHHSLQTRERMEGLLDRLKDEGLVATGALGDPDPFTAIMNALQFYSADEIVISTFPETRSGWLRGDLVERVRRATATPVEHVVSDVAPERAGAS